MAYTFKQNYLLCGPLGYQQIMVGLRADFGPHEDSGHCVYLHIVFVLFLSVSYFVVLDCYINCGQISVLLIN